MMLALRLPELAGRSSGEGHAALYRAMRCHETSLERPFYRTTSDLFNGRRFGAAVKASSCGHVSRCPGTVQARVILGFAAKRSSKYPGMPVCDTSPSVSYPHAQVQTRPPESIIFRCIMFIAFFMLGSGEFRLLGFGYLHGGPKKDPGAHHSLKRDFEFYLGVCAP